MQRDIGGGSAPPGGAAQAIAAGGGKAGILRRPCRRPIPHKINIEAFKAELEVYIGRKL